MTHNRSIFCHNHQTQDSRLPMASKTTTTHEHQRPHASPQRSKSHLCWSEPTHGEPRPPKRHHSTRIHRFGERETEMMASKTTATHEHQRPHASPRRSESYLCRSKPTHSEPRPPKRHHSTRNHRFGERETEMRKKVQRNREGEEGWIGDFWFRETECKVKRERGSLRLVVESVKIFFKLMRLTKNKNKKN